ncbi:SUN-domain-containing protein [Xylariaceae sp. FL0662B]|nr:SUN-domain-containing protein [Xylariaceae sp. FL0662B]
MKATILNIAIAATLASGAVAQPHHHGHHHHKKHNSLAEKRDVKVETTYAPATVTQYMLGNEEVGIEEAKAGLDKGLYIVVGETTPTFTPPPPPPVTTSSAPSSSATVEDAVFIQKASSSSSSPPAASSSTSATGSDDDGSLDSVSGVDLDFPDGEVRCSEFPSKYGAVPLEYLGFKGWTGIQFTPDFHFGVDLSIGYISTGVKADFTSDSGWKPGFYSYACPEGYLKSQWPVAQGSTKESIGGLYCTNDGYLKLTRPGSSKLCQKGIGGVTIKNKMSQGAALCRTDYPGTEAMVIPVDTQPGKEYALANIYQDKYYQWDGKMTTLQYYVNQGGISYQDACVWDCAFRHDECGDKAPTILGVGKAPDGITYLSLFRNSPANLNYNIDITGDITSDCYVHNGGYPDGSTGCTTGIKDGGHATVTFTDA